MAARKWQFPEILPTPLKGKLKEEDIIRAVDTVRARRLQREAEEKAARRAK